MIRIATLIHKINLTEATQDAETTGHMTHTEHWSIYGDPEHGLEHAEAMHRFFNGEETEGHSVSLKADGGVSLVVGRKKDGRHFITYKSGKKHFHSAEEIDAAGVPWAEDGKKIFKHVQEMNIKPGTAFQGDVLWADREKDIQDDHIRPNTVRYKPTHHSMGIAVHSQYDVDDNDNLIRSTNVPDIKQLKHDDVFVPDLQLKPGQIKLTKERNDAVRESLIKAREALTPEAHEYARSVAADPTIHKFMQEYLNETVATTGKKTVQSLRDYIHRPIFGARTSHGYMEKSTQRSKSDKAREALVKKLEDHISENHHNIDRLFQHMQHITTAKHHMLDQVNEYRDQMGIKPHGKNEHEGIVSAFRRKIGGKFITSLAKLTREGIRGFSALNRRRGVERGFTKEREVPHPDVPFVDHTDEQLVKESHNIETLKNIPTSRLKKLHKKYSSKSSDESRKEAAVIKKIIKSRVDEEMAVGTGAGLAGLGGPKDVAVPVEAQKRYTRSGPMRRKRKIAESFLNSQNLMK